MSLTDIDLSENFRDILADLISHEGIENYIGALEFQTNQMSQKQSLKIAGPDSNDILKMALSTTTVLNSRFYAE